MPITHFIDTSPRRHWPFPEKLTGIALYDLAFRTYEWPDDAQALYGIMLPPSLDHAVKKRKAEFLAGRLCAREAIRAITGRPITPGQDDQRAPIWPEGVCGSITHSHDRAIAISGDRRHWQSLGVDVEMPLEANRADRLQQIILTASEIERWRDQPIDELITLTFSLKESLFKALYPLVRKRFYFEHAELIEWQKQGQARLRLLTDLSSQWSHGKELQAQFAHDGSYLLSLIAIAV